MLGETAWIALRDSYSPCIMARPVSPRAAVCEFGVLVRTQPLSEGSSSRKTYFEEVTFQIPIWKFNRDFSCLAPE
jgi:hypothetical protein